MLTGVSGTTAVGSATASIGKSVDVTGVASTGSVGQTFETQNGAFATGATGDVSLVLGQGVFVDVTNDAFVPVGQVGSVSVVTTQNVVVNLTAPTEATTAVGTATVSIHIRPEVTGIQVAAGINSVTVNSGSAITVNGISASTTVGSVLVLSLIHI